MQHDSTVLKLMFALDVYNWRTVPYCTCLMVELHHDEVTGNFVRVWLKNDTASETPLQDQRAFQLQVPGECTHCDQQGVKAVHLGQHHRNSNQLRN